MPICFLNWKILYTEVLVGLENQVTFFAHDKCILKDKVRVRFGSFSVIPLSANSDILEGEWEPTI